MMSAPRRLDTREEVPCNSLSAAAYHEHFNCIKKSHLDINGDCDGKLSDPDKTGVCAAYCEIKVTFIYGQETPYDESLCQSGDCELQVGTTVTYTTTWEINMNVALEVGKGALTSAFNAGASYSFSKSLGFSVLQVRTYPLAEGECGYWTWVPVLVVSCGTLTTAPVQSSPDVFGGFPTCNTASKKSIGNWCNTTPTYTNDGKAAGVSFFVLKSCAPNGGILWDHPKLNPIYKIPGVSTAPDAPKSVVEEVLADIFDKWAKEHHLK